jgi:alkanesulfonate monooxygenase SsuD/methylene tetrahydromethanopterin reductase-like flavin-dependent oxidoreductase (luciferase family)
MRYGLYMPNFGTTGDVGLVVDLARRAEASGWDGFFLWDHFSTGRLPVIDPWLALTACAVRTERIALGPMIVPLARRRVQKVALEAATLAALAPGRFILGVGMGAPEDFTKFGEEVHWRVRAQKVDDGVAMLRRAWAAEELAENVRFFDEPVPHIPIWVSGEWPRKQPFHGVAHADGVFPIHRKADGQGFEPLQPDGVRDALASVPEQARKDFAIWSWADTGEPPIEEYEAAGVTWWMTEAWGLEPDELRALADGGPQRLVRQS